METKKCAHTACTCITRDGEKYCSTYCEDAKDITTLRCECNHAACSGSTL